MKDRKRHQFWSGLLSTLLLKLVFVCVCVRNCTRARERERKSKSLFIWICNSKIYDNDDNGEAHEQNQGKICFKIFGKSKAMCIELLDGNKLNGGQNSVQIANVMRIQFKFYGLYLAIRSWLSNAAQKTQTQWHFNCENVFEDLFKWIDNNDLW